MSGVSSLGIGLVDPMTTRGDLITRNASNITDRLGVGTANKVLKTNGTDPSWSQIDSTAFFSTGANATASNPGVSTSYAPTVASRIKSHNDDYTILDDDGYDYIILTVINKVVTLPTASANTGRIITVKKGVSGLGTTTVKGEAAGETIDGISGTTGIVLDFENEAVTIQCNGSVWNILNWYIPRPNYALTSASGANYTHGGGTICPIKHYTVNAGITWWVEFWFTGDFNADQASPVTITLTGPGATSFAFLASYNPSCSCISFISAGSAFTASGGQVIASTNTVKIYSSAAARYYRVNGLNELNAKPNFVL